MYPQLAYYYQHRTYKLQYQKEYYRKNKEIISKYYKEYYRKKKGSDTQSKRIVKSKKYHAQPIIVNENTLVVNFD